MFEFINQKNLFIMKKIIFLFAFCVFFFALSSKAQVPYQIPNASFEVWNDEYSEACGDYLEFETELFYTLNSLYRENNTGGCSDITAWKDGNAQHGSYCIKLVSGRVPAGTSYVFLPGMVGTLNQEFVSEFLNSGGNVTISKLWDDYTPCALEGYFKYKPVSGDSALIDIGFYDYDGLVFVEQQIIHDNVDKWTKFSIPIPNKYWDEEFHEIRIIFAASAGVKWEKLDECKGQIGSTLWVDNISLKYNCSSEIIEQNLSSTLKVNAFPNPTTDILNLELNNNFEGKVVVFGINGSKILEENITGNKHQLNTSELPAGNYVYRLMKENTFFAQGKFVITK